MQHLPDIPKYGCRKIGRYVTFHCFTHTKMVNTKYGHYDGIPNTGNAGNKVFVHTDINFGEVEKVLYFLDILYNSHKKTSVMSEVFL
jgi:hypothetical protein